MQGGDGEEMVEDEMEAAGEQGAGGEEDEEVVEEGEEPEEIWDTQRSSKGTPPAAWMSAEFCGSTARFPRTRAALFWIDSCATCFLITSTTILIPSSLRTSLHVSLSVQQFPRMLRARSRVFRLQSVCRIRPRSGSSPP